MVGVTRTAPPCSTRSHLDKQLQPRLHHTEVVMSVTTHHSSTPTNESTCTAIIYVNTSCAHKPQHTSHSTQHMPTRVLPGARVLLKLATRPPNRRPKVRVEGLVAIPNPTCTYPPPPHTHTHTCNYPTGCTSPQAHARLPSICIHTAPCMHPAPEHLEAAIVALHAIANCIAFQLQYLSVM